LWDTASGLQLGAELAHGGSVNSVEFSPKGRALLTASGDGLGRVFTIGDPEPKELLTGHTLGVVEAHFSPDGQRIVTASEDGTARLYDAETGAVRGPPLTHHASLVFARFSPDGHRVLTGCSDGSAGIWEVSSGELVVPFLRQSASLVDGDFSPDSRWVVTGAVDGESRMWDAETGQLVNSNFEHSRRLTVTQFGPVGYRLLVGSMDRAASVTELEDLSEIAPAWLPLLAESVAVQRFDAERTLQPLTIEEALGIRAEIDQAQWRGPLGSWLRWFLADRWTRKISRKVGVEFAAYVEQQRILWSGSVSKLQRLTRLAPNSGAAAASLAMGTLRAGAVKDPYFLVRAEWLIRRAAALAPDHPDVELARSLYRQTVDSKQRQTEE